MIESSPSPSSPGTRGTPACPERVVALVGRQNSGKTSLLMQLTGTTQRPVNFPGTSVERLESSRDFGTWRLRVVDLPGIASLKPITRDEEVTLDFLKMEDEGNSATLCAVLDASKLSVELALLRNLARLGRPLVVALNKVDVARRQGRAPDRRKLEEALGVPVVETNAFDGGGKDVLLEALRTASAPCRSDFSPEALADSVQPAGSGRPTGTQRLDSVLLHPVLGLPLLALVVYGVFQSVFTLAEPLVGAIESAQAWLGAALGARVPPGALQSFLVDGLVNGLGSIVVFLPQIVILIALVAVLEASGYMARAAFLLDRVLGRVGLSGRSFVPLASSFACAIPGILATRIIDDERDRLTTIAISPLMSCSARLPVYVVLIGAFFPASAAGLVLFGLYALGVGCAFLVAFVLRRTVLRGGRSLLLMELPSYHRPSLRVVSHQVWNASRDFFTTAGTVIFVSSIVVWLVSYYPRPVAVHERFEASRAAAVAELEPGPRNARLAELDAAESAAYLEQSYLARIGKTVTPVFAPAGFEWRTTVGILAAFPARELIVPTLGILYSLGDVDAGDYDLASLEEGSDGGGLRQKLVEARREDGSPAFTPRVALAVMVFFALCSQCAATLGTIRRETRSWRWPIFTFTSMTVLAWLAATATYQIGRLWWTGG